MQSKSVDNLYKLLQLRPPDSVPGLCPWTPLEDFCLSDPWAMAPK